MKQLGLLIVGAFLFVACNSKPGGNKGILPIVHENEKEAIETEKNTVESVEDNVLVEQDSVENQSEASDDSLSEQTETTPAPESME